MINIKFGGITFGNYPPSQPGKDYKFEILNSGQIIATAYVKSMQNQQGKFWHLDDLFVQKNNRSQGYGTQLLDHLRKYLWKIDRLKIRVHPANEEQVEEFSEIYKHNNEQYTDEELDAIDRETEQAIQQPGFWNQLAEKSENRDSERLKNWYRKRGFTHDDPDGKHLWCYPD
ncbi:MAG: GNAT family N-acetyltransferase [Nostocaceae cyanobacterium]|nr:GNAT family N-acetyltransferase [Nostocaceae cyanobacterium]